MTSHDPQIPQDAEAQARFDLLMHPEQWPEDPVLQAELAELLDLHLALQSHGEALAATPKAVPRGSWMTRPWFMAAAALLIGLVPTAFALQQHQATLALQRDRTRIDVQARARSQERAWTTFFQQSGQLIQDFARNPVYCDAQGRPKIQEDRSAERIEAQALLDASRQLALQGTARAQAETVRQDLHMWLSELALEDACMDPKRAHELRQFAAARDLQDMAQRLSRPAQEAR